MYITFKYKFQYLNLIYSYLKINLVESNHNRIYIKL